ncbi:MAG: hypothetical protein AB7V58_05475 [Solirubrobacterales bacterium]
MTNRRRPAAAAVIWSSLALFGVLFALLTYQLSSNLGASSTSPRPTLVRKVVKRKVVTTVVPTPGRSTVTAGPVSTSESGAEAAPITTGAS